LELADKGDGGGSRNLVDHFHTTGGNKEAQTELKMDVPFPRKGKEKDREVVNRT